MVDAPNSGWWSHPAQWSLQQWADWLRSRERWTPLYGDVFFHLDEDCARAESPFVQVAPSPAWAIPCDHCGQYSPDRNRTMLRTAS
jgi:hypothetical protein